MASELGGGMMKACALEQNIDMRRIRALETAIEKLEQSKAVKYAREVYLYGSLARGNARWDSDIDLLLVLDGAGYEDKGLKKEIITLKGSMTEDNLDAPEIDLKVVFGKEWRDSNAAYYKNIVAEGKKIWENI